MADAVALTACRDVTANWLKELRLPSSSLRPNIGQGEMSSDRLETLLACSGDLPGVVETTSPRNLLT